MQDFTPTNRARSERPTFQFIKQLILAFCLLTIGQYSYACSSSGFNIDDITANPDGTYTVTMTISVSGPNDTGLSTWGFWFDANNPVLSISPPTLTSANGTTIAAVITGDIITWGDPTGGPGLPFVEVPGPFGTQTFTVTMVLANIIGDWEGGGQEGILVPVQAVQTPMITWDLGLVRLRQLQR